MRGVIVRSVWLMVLAIGVCGVTAIASASLRVGYYRTRCPNAEAIVRKAVKRAMSRDPGVAAALIRMHFHDCFVRGCDASILLDTTPENASEKENAANTPSLRGFEVIDDAKRRLESRCSQTVSCADILTFAARDSVCETGGSHYRVPSGRRDGRVSLKDEPSLHLPSPSLDAKQLEESFAKKGLTLDEMVTLSGAHSIGVSRCSSFSGRLFSFNSTHEQDPSLNPGLAKVLRSKCRSDMDSTVDLDVKTPNRLDNEYYLNLMNRNVVLTSDQSLMNSSETARMVRFNAENGRVWARRFARAMVKMGSIEVLTGFEGEVRKNCRVVNPYI
ncbi:PREDICTED: peroxidase 5-like [Tarenaya hassleriana]|uniref:peroxidase 5-like n=1 Tax=Tarenaya hassleriana TaxID=28532 RepID=UPI00053C4046|nr:PREDICTED: peroxidase 5-like [Tarenaya hassleriana]